MRKAILLAQIALLFFAAFQVAEGSGPQRLIYRERTGNRVETHTYVIEPHAGGFRVVLTRHGEEGEIIDECDTDASLSTQAWRHRHPARQTDVTATRRGRVIELSGRSGGEEIRKVFPINHLPWKQLFSIDFDSFTRMAETESGFWSIGTAGAGNMKIAQFKVRREETRTIDFLGRPVEAVCLRVSLRGMLATFWHGDYWMRRSDGRYLRYEGRNGLFAARTVKELISEG